MPLASKLGLARVALARVATAAGLIAGLGLIVGATMTPTASLGDVTVGATRVTRVGAPLIISPAVMTATSLMYSTFLTAGGKMSCGRIRERWRR